MCLPRTLALLFAFECDSLNPDPKGGWDACDEQRTHELAQAAYGSSSLAELVSLWVDTRMNEATENGLSYIFESENLS